MPRFLIRFAILSAFALAALIGCKHEPLPTKTSAEEQQATTTEQQKKMLEDILKYQQQSGATLDSLSKEIARRKAVEAQAMGVSPLQRDLAVARALLIAARRAAQSEDYDGCVAFLKRLAAVVDVMQGETPAAEISTYLERASLALQGSAAGVEADVASACVLGALDVALKSSDAPLVPDVAKSLDKTKAIIDKGDYKQGVKSVEAMIPTVAGHASVRLLDNAAAGVAGARAAVERQAGLVVLAELDQLSDIFNRFATMLKAAPAGGAPEAANQEPTAEETPLNHGAAPQQPPQGQPKGAPAAKGEQPPAAAPPAAPGGQPPSPPAAKSGGR